MLNSIGEPTVVNNDSKKINYNKSLASSSNHKLAIVWSGYQNNGSDLDIFFKQSILGCKI